MSATATRARPEPEVDTPSPLTQKISAALADNSASSVDLRALSTEVSARRAELEQRFSEIRPGGPERRRVELAGSPAALSALQRAAELARLEIEQLQAQSQALSSARERALDREASEGLPALVSELDGALTNAEAAQEVHDRSLVAVRRASDAVRTARVRALRARLPAATVDTSAITRIAQIAARCQQTVGTFNTRHLSELAIDLGAVEKREGRPA